jgi:hypothetical protein
MTPWRYYVYLCPDEAAFRAAWPTDDTGKPASPILGVAGRQVLPGTRKIIKDDEGNDVAIFEPSKTAKARASLVAIREDDKDLRAKLSAHGTLYRHTRQKVNQLKAEHPDIAWDDLGSFAGVRPPTTANEYPED